MATVEPRHYRRENEKAREIWYKLVNIKGRGTGPAMAEKGEDNATRARRY